MLNTYLLDDLVDVGNIWSPCAGSGWWRTMVHLLFCDRWSVGQSVLLSGLHLEPMTRILLLLHICGRHVVRRPPWREGGSVIYSHSQLPLSGWSPTKLMTTSYPILLSVWFQFPECRSRSHVTTDGQSVNMSRYRALSEACDQILLSVRRFFSESCCRVSVGRPLWQKVGSVICLSQSSNLPVCTPSIYITCVLQFSNLYTILADYPALPEYLCIQIFY
jgi:hypothetical protein